MLINLRLMDNYSGVLLRIHNMATAGGSRLAASRHVGEHVGGRERTLCLRLTSPTSVEGIKPSEKHLNADDP